MLNFKPSIKEKQYIDKKKFKYLGKEEGTWELVSNNKLQIADMTIEIEEKGDFYRYQTNLESMKKYFPESTFDDFLLTLNYDYEVPARFREYARYIKRENELMRILPDANGCKIYSSKSRSLLIEIDCVEIEMIREKSELLVVAKISGEPAYDAIFEIDNPRSVISRYYTAWKSMLAQNRVQDPTNKMIKTAKYEKIIDQRINHIMKTVYSVMNFIDETDFSNTVSSIYRFQDFTKADLLLLRNDRIILDDPELEYITPTKFKYVNKSAGNWEITDDGILNIGEMKISFEEIMMSTPLVRFNVQNMKEEKYFSRGGLGKLLIELCQRYQIDLRYSLYENLCKEKKLIEYLKSNQCSENVNGLYINRDSFNVRFDEFDIEVHKGLPILRKDGLIHDHETHRKLVDLLLNFEM